MSENVKNDKGIRVETRAFSPRPCAPVYATSYPFFENRKHRTTFSISGFGHFGGSKKSLLESPSALRK